VKTLRPIKFRGKPLENNNDNQFVFGSLGVIHEDLVAIYWCNEFVDDGIILVDPETVGQFTGETDDCETEIYENDILWDARYEEYCYVTYSEGGFNIIEDNISWNMQECDMNDFTVVGNIHDHLYMLGG
jgi:hypothetical protein